MDTVTAAIDSLILFFRGVSGNACSPSVGNGTDLNKDRISTEPLLKTSL